MIFGFLKSKQKIKTDAKQNPPEKLRVLVVYSSESLSMLAMPKILNALKTRPFFEIITASEEKIFSTFDHKNFFDIWDGGLQLLKRHNGEVLIRVCSANDFVRVYFQAPQMYQSDKIPFFSLSNSLLMPMDYFKGDQIPLQICALIFGILIVLAKKESDFYQAELKKILHVLSRNKMPENTPSAFLPHILNLLALIYMKVYGQAFCQKDAKLILSFLKSGFKNAGKDDLVLQGNLYACLGQMYQTTLNDQKADSLVLLKRGIESYKKALKYFNRYVFMYDYGRLNLVLSNLYFHFYHLTDDTQALRDAIAYLKNAEQVFTFSGHPFLWAVIEDKLGKYLSDLGAKSASKEIAAMAVEYLKNKQKVYTKEYAPDMWAQTEADIGAIYDHLGREYFNAGLLDKALSCYESALEVFRALNQTPKAKELENTIARTTDVFHYHNRF